MIDGENFKAGGLQGSIFGRSSCFFACLLYRLRIYLFISPLGLHNMDGLNKAVF